MKRLSSILVVGMLVATVAACGGSTGGLGSVPTAAPIPSDEPGGPDLTPGPSNPGEPVRGAVRGPGRDPVEPTVGRPGWQLPRRPRPRPGPRSCARTSSSAANPGPSVSSRSCARCPRPPRSHARR